MTDERATLIIVPGDGTESRTYRMPFGHGRATLRRGLWAIGTVGVLFAASWVYFAWRSVEAARLEARVAEMEEDRAAMQALAATLEEVEARYAQLRGLFGSGTGLESEVWLPPAAGRSGGSTDDDDPTPSSWPLTQRGFVTQPLLEGAEARAHPGLDIAVPTDSYIRASAPGRVVESGDDPVYGRYIVLDHGNGYRTRYAHASLLLVDEGASVRRHEVIALSGNTGQSTAPHLHFEILLDGVAVDPLSLVRQPA
ncbi:MAG: M23 family metallopeptidase [Acidimicrobiia bacterium]|nr:M23 family metallopeptidase [Acidimicrobiia bacterium]